MDFAPQRTHEKLYFDGDEFFKDIIDAICRAQDSIYIEMYIFRTDRLGQALARHLIAASSRGVEIRILIDGVGSYFWLSSFAETFINTSVEFRVYHPLPWSKFIVPLASESQKIKLSKLWTTVNKRNHRKVIIIDRSEAWAGSINIAEYHMREFSGENAWRDAAVKIRGDDVNDLIFAFKKAWHAPKSINFQLSYKQKRKYEKLNLSVRLNFNRKLRKKFTKELLYKINHATRNIWITNAYFVPRRTLFKALKHAARRGVDVRVISPRISDVFFIPWLTLSYYSKMAREGIKVFRYLPAMLHSKTIIIDDWTTIGSTNLNHRSFIHDLEVDIVILNEENKDILKKQFLSDLHLSQELSENELAQRPFWQKIIGRLILAFRYWL